MCLFLGITFTVAYAVDLASVHDPSIQINIGGTTSVMNSLVHLEIFARIFHAERECVKLIWSKMLRWILANKDCN